MTDKMEFYEIMGVIVPGSLLVLVVPVAFPALATLLAPSSFPDAFKVIVLIALAIFFGQAILAVGSLLEPPLHWTFGGRPSDRALEAGLGPRYLPPDSAKRIKARLAEATGPGASERSLFLYAMRVGEAAQGSRVSRFNGLYAYHRSLLVLLLASLSVLASSLIWGAASSWTWQQAAVATAVLLALVALFWYRTKQRAYYYVREVLFTAEHVIMQKAGQTGADAAKQGG